MYKCEQNLGVLAAMQVGSTNSMAAADKILAGLEASITRIEAMRPPDSVEPEPFARGMRIPLSLGGLGRAPGGVEVGAGARLFDELCGGLS